jgi:hypothetical protein
MNNYIPAKIADFAVWAANFSTKLTANPTDYGLIAGDAVIVDAAWDIFTAAYALSSVPATRTSPAIAATDAARASLEAVIRPYAVLISANPAIPAQDKVDIGVTVRATTRTPTPAPTDAPAVTILSAIPLSQTLEYAVPGNIGKAKPNGSIGMELRRSIGVVAATDPDQCAHVGTFTKSPLTQSFDAANQGKICTYFARFVTRGGPAGQSQSGPWSAPLTLYVI